MPLYEYECEACTKRFEKIHKFSDPPADVCAHCGKGPVRKLPSSPAIQFKGSGFYITDYAKKDSSSTKESKTPKESKESKDSKDSKDTSSSGESATKVETKPTKTE